MLILLFEFIDIQVFHRKYVAIQFELLATRKDLLRSPFGDHTILTLGGADDDRHDAPLEIEGNLIDLGIAWDVDMCLGVQQDRPVQDILEPGLKVAVQVSQREDGIALLQNDIAVLLQNHLVHGECARLVGAQHIHRPQILDRVQAFDDHLLAADLQGPFGQADRHDHRQHLGRQSDRHCHCKEEGLRPLSLSQSIDQEYQRDHHQNESQHEPGEPRDSLIKGRGSRVLGQDLSHATQIGLGSGGDHDRGGCAAFDARPQIRNAGQLQWCDGGGRFLDIVLFNGQALSSEWPLSDEQILRRDDADITRNHVPRRQLDHVTWHELREGNLLGDSLAHDSRGD